MSYDLHANFAYSSVVTAPSPASSGTTLTVTTGEGALFPTPPFNAVVWAFNAIPTVYNATIIRVTGIVGNVLTFTRTQEGSSNRSILVRDQISAPLTKKTLTDIETAVAAITTDLSGKADDSAVVHKTLNETITGIKSFTSDVIVPDEVYGSGWNASLEVPTKNALYDKIETLGAGGASNLADLDDVAVVGVGTGDFLQYQPEGNWAPGTAVEHFNGSGGNVTLASADGSVIVSGGADIDLSVPDVSRLATVTIGPSGTDADFETDGLEDGATIALAVAALPSTGGRLYIRNGTYNFDSSADRVYMDKSNVIIEGETFGGVIFKATADMDPGGADAQARRGMLNIGVNQTTKQSHVAIRNIVFDCNDQYKAAGLCLDGGTSLTDQIGLQDVMVENVVIKNGRAGQPVKNAGLHLISGVTQAFGTDKGFLDNITLRNVELTEFEDNACWMIGSGFTNIKNYDLWVHDNDQSGIFYYDSQSLDITSSDWSYNNCRFERNCQVLDGGDWFAGWQHGVHNLTFKDCYFGQHNKALSNVFGVLLYWASNNRITDCIFDRCKSSINLATSYAGRANTIFPTNRLFIVDNVFYQCYNIFDPDSTIFAMVKDNIFYEIEHERVLGSYSRHFPTVYDGNIIYNCHTLNTALDPDYHQAAIQVGADGFDVRNNYIIDDRHIPTPTEPLSITTVSGGALGSRTYYIRYTWVSDTGETDGSAQVTQAVAANHLLQTQAPNGHIPSGARSLKVYVSTTNGSGWTLQGTITDLMGMYDPVQWYWTEPTSGLVAGTALPSTNTTVTKTLFGIYENSVAETGSYTNVYQDNHFIGIDTPIYEDVGSRRISRGNVTDYDGSASVIGERVPLEPVRYATAGPLPTNTYSNGVAGVGATITYSNFNQGVDYAGIDGITGNSNFDLGDRILVKDEADPTHNGIYTITINGGAGVYAVLTRASDFTDPSLFAGSTVMAELGTTNAGCIFSIQGEGPYIIGTTDIVWGPVARTSVSVATANGFAGSVASSIITMTTTITGLLKGNGTAVSAATAGTDYLAPSGSGASLTDVLHTTGNESATGLKRFINDDTYFGAGAGGGTGGYADIGSFGGTDVWVDARSSATNSELNLRAKGTGFIVNNSQAKFTDIVSMEGHSLRFGATASDDAHRIKYNGTVDGLEYYGYNGHLWGIAALEKMRLDNTGLGIGKTAAYKLDVNGTANATTLQGSVLDSGGQFINVKHPTYGATGNGSTDDTTAIQAALTACDTTGGTVFFPAGTYIVSTLLISSRTTVLGTGISTTLKLKNTTNGFMFTTRDTSAGATTYPHDHQFRDLYFDLNKANNATAAGAIKSEKNRNLIVERCSFVNYRGRCLSITGAVGNNIQPRILNNQFDTGDTTDSTGLFLDSGCYDSHVNRNDFGRSYRGMVVSNGGNGHHTITDNQFWGNQDVGLQLYQTHNNMLTGNTFDRNFSHGLEVNGCNNVTFVNCKFSNNSFDDTSNEFGFGAGFGTANTASGMRVINASTNIRVIGGNFSNPDACEQYGIVSEGSSAVYYSNSTFSALSTGNTNLITSGTITNLDSTGSVGITRTIVSSSGSFTAGATASTDYVYLLTAAHVPTMPTAVSNTNRYTFKNNHSANITFLTTSSQTIDGGSLTLPPNASVDLISNNANWFII